MVESKAFEACSACGSGELNEVCRLDRFPHIGIYLENREKSVDFQPIDNALFYCPRCAHIQLERAVDPEFLYTPEFQHRTSQSASAMQANEFLFGFASKYVDVNDKQTLVAEVGCNDSFLLSKFAKNGARVVGVDPILKGREVDFVSRVDSDVRDKFSIVGDYIEKVNFAQLFGQSPSLYVTNFVFEHLFDPWAVTQSIVSSMAPKAVAIIGVPGAEFLVGNSRFDQLSHQHYQQFNETSLRAMVERAGGEVLDVACNFPNWGQLLIAFRAGRPSQTVRPVPYSLADVRGSLAAFRTSLAQVTERVARIPGHKPVFGYGAAQNFPVLHWFAQGAVGFSRLLDDHPLRQNRYYPDIPMKIEAPDRTDYTGHIGVIAGPDYARPLVARMTALKFDHIISIFPNL